MTDYVEDKEIIYIDLSGKYIIYKAEKWFIQAKEFSNEAMPYKHKIRAEINLIKDNNSLICVDKKTMEKVENVSVEVVCIEMSTNKEIGVDPLELGAEQLIKNWHLKEKLEIEND